MSQPSRWIRSGPALVRLLSAVVAAAVLWRAVEGEMQWLAITAFVLLVAVLLPGFLVDMINRLRPFRAGPFEAGRVASQPAAGPPDEWLRETQEVVNQRLEELRKDITFLYQPEMQRLMYEQVAALTVRMTAAEEQIVTLRRLQIGGG